MTAQDKQHLEALKHSARIVVRETGNVAAWAENSVDAGHPMYRNIMHAYDMACAHLTQLDRDGSAEFIRSTYGPTFRQTEAKEPPCWHKVINEAGFCAKCGNRVAIKLEA